MLTIGAARLRQGSVLIVLVLCLVQLSACAGGGSKPFAKGEGTPGPSGKTVPPIALLDVTGMPPTTLSQFKDALAVAAGKRDMAIIDSRLDNTTLTLTGHFTIVPEAGAVKLDYNWTLTDPAGAVLHTISAEETAPGSPSGDPWLQITPPVLQRIAAYTAESLSSRLSQLGYATEVGGIPPPLETYAKAGPDADKDIDFETLYGPGKGPSSVAESHATIDGMAVAQAQETAAEQAALTAPETEAESPRAEKTALAVEKRLSQPQPAKSAWPLQKPMLGQPRPPRLPCLQLGQRLLEQAWIRPTSLLQEPKRHQLGRTRLTSLLRRPRVPQRRRTKLISLSQRPPQGRIKLTSLPQTSDL
jgi:hypothetical protein